MTVVYLTTEQMLAHTMKNNWGTRGEYQTEVLNLIPLPK